MQKPKLLDQVRNLMRVKHKRLPEVFTQTETKAVINELEGATRIIVSLLYGSGMRLTEVLRLRVKDIDFETQRIVVRSGKGAKDRATVLPLGVADALRSHLRRVKFLARRRFNARLRRGPATVCFES